MTATVRGEVLGRSAPEFALLLFEQEGVCTAAQATGALGRGVVRGAVRGGRWRQVCRGILVNHTGPLLAGQTHWIAVLAAGGDAVLGGLTAAHEGGLRLGRPGPVQLLIAGGRQVDLTGRMPLDMPAIVVHRSDHLPVRQVQPARPTRTTMPRSVVDAAQWAQSDEQAQTIVAAACQQRLVRPGMIRDVLTEMPRARRRALVLATLNDIEGGATTLAEIDFVKLCRRFGLPVPELQEGRRDAAGRQRYLDVYWRRWRLHVEVDGAHHMEVGQWEADMRRQNDIWISGDRILRFSAWQVRNRADDVVGQLQAALEAAGWAPGDVSRSR